MARWLFLVVLLVLSGCAHTALRADETFSARDYLQTALETLAASDPDVGGHRLRAQLETKAALEVMGDVGASRSVPYDGPPRLEVALELLERCEAARAVDEQALQHARMAAAELREALTKR
jgi:hypothetical protein